MPSIAEVVKRIQQSGLPVLFLDSCVLLDVIRAPLRPGQLPGCVEVARALLRPAAAPPMHCTIVAGSFVRREWLAHSDLQAAQLRDHISEIDDDAARLHHLCALMGVPPSFPAPDYRPLCLADRLLDLSRRLMDTALHLDQDNDCIIRAHHRASNHLAPSIKGGEIKDSTIIEECLEVSRRLHALGYLPRRLFCTSNTNDYCGRSSAKLHPTLVVDFGAASLEFATNLPWAVNVIKKP